MRASMPVTILQDRPGQHADRRTSEVALFLQVADFKHASDPPSASAQQNGHAECGEHQTANGLHKEEGEFKALDSEGVKAYLAARPALAKLLGPAADSASWKVRLEKPSCGNV